MLVALCACPTPTLNAAVRERTAHAGRTQVFRKDPRSRVGTGAPYRPASQAVQDGAEILPVRAIDSALHDTLGSIRADASWPRGNTLFVINTPDNRLEIFDVSLAGLTLADDGTVGMEPARSRLAPTPRSGSSITSPTV